MAAHGYLALAPDLYERQVMDPLRPQARSRQLQAGPGRRSTSLDAARAFWPVGRTAPGKIGVIGFCMGGGFALLCAPRDGFAVASVNYGEVPQDAEKALAGACPIVGSFGARDLWAPSTPERLQRALTVLEVPHDVEVYPGPGTGSCPSPPGRAGCWPSSPG